MLDSKSGVLSLIWDGRETLDTVLIIGCGDIGRRIAALYLKRGWPVDGVARSADTLANMRAHGIQIHAADLDRPETLQGLPTAQAVIFYLAPPPSEGAEDARMRGFLSFLPSTGLPEKIVYISTSGVYGDCQGAWVTEDAPTQPQHDRSRRRLSAELALLAFQEHTQVPVAILRVGGIYGPDRLPLERIKRKEPVLRLAECGYTNRIHADDLAAVCVAAAEYGHGIYNVSDGHPGTMSEYFFQIADLFGLPRPPEISLSEARQRISATMLSYLEESRRLDNRKMLVELGVKLKFPTLEAGLADCVKTGGT